MALQAVDHGGRNRAILLLPLIYPRARTRLAVPATRRVWTDARMQAHPSAAQQWPYSACVRVVSRGVPTRFQRAVCAACEMLRQHLAGASSRKCFRR